VEWHGKDKIQQTKAKLQQSEERNPPESRALLRRENDCGDETKILI